MLPLFAFLLCWIIGQALLFLYLKNQNTSLHFQDVFNSFLLSTAVGFVFSFAAWKANIFHWTTAIAFTAVAAYITHKFLEKAQTALVSSAKGLYATGAAPSKSDTGNTIFVAVAGVIYLLIVLCFTTFNTYTHVAYARQEGWVHIAGIVLVGLSYALVFNANKQILPAKSEGWYWFATLALLAIGLGTLGGFNFDISGVNIP